MVFLPRSVGRFAGLAACFFLLGLPCVFAQKAGSLLPARFSGWVAQSAPTSGTVAAKADAQNVDALTEYGLKEFAQGTYHRGAAQVRIRAMRFVDATGAYGAYTFYRKPEMKPKDVGNGGAADAQEVIFWSGVTMVDVAFDPPAAVTTSALDALAAALPAASGPVGVAPSLPGYLPAKSLDKATVKYTIGPASYIDSGGVLPASTIGFNRDAEVVTAQYSAHSGRGTLTLIGYPTPQLAINAEKAINAMLKEPLPPGLQQGNPASLGVRRSGPVVAVTSGNFSSAEAQALLGQVKYRAQVTWSHPQSGASEVKKAAEMLLGIAYLTAILISMSLLLAAFLGGGRALWRTMHGRPASSVFEEDFISLNLSGWNPGAPRKLP